MTGPKLQRLLFRLYINWAITLLFLFIPKLIHHAKEHAAQAGELLAQGEQQIEIAAVLAEEAANHANREWCEKRALELEQEAGEAEVKYGESPTNYRNPGWCATQSKMLQKESYEIRREAELNKSRAARKARWANGLALLDILPFWAIGAFLPWILHFSIAGLLRRSANARVRSGSSSPGDREKEG